MTGSESSSYFPKRALLSLSDALEIASKVEVRKWCGRSLPLLPESALKTKVTMFSVDLGGFDSGFQTTEKKSSKSAPNFNLLDFFSVVFALPLLPESASKTKVTMFSVDSGGSDSGFQKLKIILSGARFASWAITGVYTFEPFGCIGNYI